VYGATGLVWAINQANADGRPSVICLAPGGLYTLTSTSATEIGLPVVNSVLTIKGRGATIRRSDGAPEMRLIHNGISGDLTLRDLSLQNGSLSSSDGGAVYNHLGLLAMDNCTISGNSASSAGGVFNSSGQITITNSTFDNNSATNAQGGAIKNFGSSATLTLDQSTISGNSAIEGGGLYNSDGTIYINNSAITSNSAGISAGGLYNNVFGTVTVINSQLSGNSSYSFGGALSTNSASMTVNDSCINQNVSPVGSAVVNLDSENQPVDAILNWWGAPDGPSGIGSGSGDAIFGNVTYIPFRTAPLPFCN
jgi:hypothetical protein